jgi:hypothetical protein
VSATLAGVMAAIALVACRDASGVGRFFQGLAVRWSPSGDHRLQCRDAFGVGLRGTSSFFFGRSRLAERTRRPTFRKQPLRAAFGALTNARKAVLIGRSTPPSLGTPSVAGKAKSEDPTPSSCFVNREEGAPRRLLRL